MWGKTALYLTDNLIIAACSSAYTANFWGSAAGQNQDPLGDYDTPADVAKPEPSSSPLHGCPTPESVHSNSSVSEMADSSDNAAHNASSSSFFFPAANSPPEIGTTKGKGGKGKGE